MVGENLTRWLGFRFQQIHCIDVKLKDNVGRAIIEYVNHTAIENLVLGASKIHFH